MQRQEQLDNQLQEPLAQPKQVVKAQSSSEGAMQAGADMQPGGPGHLETLGAVRSDGGSPVNEARHRRLVHWLQTNGFDEAFYAGYSEVKAKEMEAMEASGTLTGTDRSILDLIK